MSVLQNNKVGNILYEYLITIQYLDRTRQMSKVFSLGKMSSNVILKFLSDNKFLGVNIHQVMNFESQIVLLSTNQRPGVSGWTQDS